MKQVLQDLRRGAIEVAEVPAPLPAAGHVLIQTRASLLSSGTERAVLEFARSSLLAKALSQPERIRQVLEKVRADGWLPALEAVVARLDERLPLGYCNAGVVLDAGPDIRDLKPGDRVASNGPHAEVVSVPRNLCARIPDGVDDDQAAFTVLGAVALQGVRLLSPAIGESVAVIGLGLVGLLSVQILRAAGCRVLGVDPQANRRDLALRLGAEDVSATPPEGDPVAAAGGVGGLGGVDGVLICAAGGGKDVVRYAARMCRKRGRIVLVGVVGLELDRSEFYQKELTFQVSCSYGPGRYDPDYELRGHDYPHAYVRWTEQRNFEAVLELLRSGQLRVDTLIDRRFPQAGASAAYEVLTGEPGILGILLDYPAQRASRVTRVEIGAGALPGPRPGVPTLGVLGAGHYARQVILPILRRSGALLKTVATRSGHSATHAARRFAFREASTDGASVVQDPAIDAVFILTRHDSHARLAAEALSQGKHVFVEKPLALRRSELESVVRAHAGAQRHLMVGFNRRFAPLARRLRALIAGRASPVALMMTVNAGALPPGHWLSDPVEGGGRLLGEGIHWIDWLYWLAGSSILSVSATGLPAPPGLPADGFILTLRFADRSVGVLHYLTNGSRRYPKERLEAFFDGRVARLENFRRLETFGVPGFRGARSWRQDKGHRAAVQAFLRAIAEGGASPIPFPDVRHVTLAALAADEALRKGIEVSLQAFDDAHDTHGESRHQAASSP
jgi:predicted dehydrogenase/threonine dehydrogenase-like Zn-dependent dehydrogenase